MFAILCRLVTVLFFCVSPVLSVPPQLYVAPDYYCFLCFPSAVGFTPTLCGHRLLLFSVFPQCCRFHPNSMWPQTIIVFCVSPVLSVPPQLYVAPDYYCFLCFPSAVGSTPTLCGHRLLLFSVFPQCCRFHPNSMWPQTIIVFCVSPVLSVPPQLYVATDYYCFLCFPSAVGFTPTLCGHRLLLFSVFPQCCRFHPNSNYVATGSSDNSVRLWDMLNGSCTRVMTGHKVRRGFC